MGPKNKGPKWEQVNIAYTWPSRPEHGRMSMDYYSWERYKQVFFHWVILHLWLKQMKLTKDGASETTRMPYFLTSQCYAPCRRQITWRSHKYLHIRRALCSQTSCEGGGIAKRRHSNKPNWMKLYNCQWIATCGELPVVNPAGDVWADRLRFDCMIHETIQYNHNLACWSSLLYTHVYKSQFPSIAKHHSNCSHAISNATTILLLILHE